MEWRDIETAPRDGTPHDIWVPNLAGGIRHTDVVYIPPEECPEGLGYWRMNDASEWFVTALDEKFPPTHWMPIPPPPGEGDV